MSFRHRQQGDKRSVLKTMKLTAKQLRSLTREAVEEAVSCIDEKDKLEPVGHEDDDINNDCKKDKIGDYLRNRRNAFGRSMKSGK